MSDQHKTWVKSALNDLSAAVCLHGAGFWINATLNAQQAGEKLGKAILILCGVNQIDVKDLSHRIPKINDKIEELGLYSFNEEDRHMAKEMQRMYQSQKYPDGSTEDAPHEMVDKIDSEGSIQWAVNYLDMAMNIMPGVISEDQRDSIHQSFTAAKEVANTCKKCKATPCICSGSRPKSP